MTSIPRGGVIDPVAVQNALRKRTGELETSVMQQAFQGNGDVDLWISKARSVATTTASYSAGANLDLQRQRHDPQAVQQEDIAALATEDGRARREINELVAGTAGLAEWFKRAQQIGFAAAAHASRASELCDASTADALAAPIDAGINAAINAAAGSGGVQYWADRTGTAANRVNDSRLTALADVARSAAVPAAPSTGVPADTAQQHLHRLRESMLTGMETSAFGVRPATTSLALQTAMQTGALALEYGGRVTLEVAALRTDRQAPSDDVLKMLSEKADASIERAAALGLQGSGFAQYWFECNASVAALASSYAALAASHCNAALLDAVRPPLETLLSHTPRTVYGEAQAWMEQASASANSVIPALQEVSVEMRAVAAAQRAEVSAEAPQPADEAAADKARLEADKRLQLARVQAWDQTAERRTHDQTVLQQRINELSTRLQPLNATSATLQAQLNRYNLCTFGGFVGLLSGSLFATAWLVPGLATAAAGAALLTGAVLKSRAPRAELVQVTEQRAAIEQEMANAAVPLVTARTLSAAAFSHRDDAEKRLHAIDGRLDIHHMAEAVNRAAPGDATVHVDDDTVRIGNVVIHRNRVSENELRR